MLEFGPMADLLRIPDEKRGNGSLTSLFERPDRGWSFWTIAAVIAVLNCWFDYYHPLGILFDIAFFIGLVIVWGRQKR